MPSFSDAIPNVVAAQIGRERDPSARRRECSGNRAAAFACKQRSCRGRQAAAPFASMQQQGRSPLAPGLVSA
jgi:hypothetical protein